MVFPIYSLSQRPVLQIPMLVVLLMSSKNLQIVCLVICSTALPDIEVSATGLLFMKSFPKTGKMIFSQWKRCSHCLASSVALLFAFEASMKNENL